MNNHGERCFDVHCLEASTVLFGNWVCQLHRVQTNLTLHCLKDWQMIFYTNFPESYCNRRAFFTLKVNYPLFIEKDSCLKLFMTPEFILLFSAIFWIYVYLYKICAIISGEIQHTYLLKRKFKTETMEIVSATSVTTISRGKVHKNLKRYK